MRQFYDEYAYNVGRGPDYRDEGDLPASSPVAAAVRLIAYYLPQFHAIPENDRWWGRGFTEWTNVTKALPRYAGHRQPQLPADLGFYDLSDSAVLRRQADLARRAGLLGFCIHNYWFAGKRLLERPLDALLADRSIDLPFCLNWANENWTRRWDGSESHVLLEQRYDPDDWPSYLRSILPALRDPRYIRVNGRSLLMIYRPGIIPDATGMVAAWRSFLRSEGVGDPYLVMAQVFDDEDPRPYGLDAAAGFPPNNAGWNSHNDRARLRLFDRGFKGHVRAYADVAANMLAKRPADYRLMPGVMPGWDNEARKPGRGLSFHGATPARYADWLYAAVGQAMTAPSADERIVFVNAWNEWAEGAVLEPDRHAGFAYLVETRRVLDAITADEPLPAASRGDHRFVAAPRRRNLVINKARAVAARLFGAAGG